MYIYIFLLTWLVHLIIPIQHRIIVTLYHRHCFIFSYRLPNFCSPFIWSSVRLWIDSQRAFYCCLVTKNLLWSWIFPGFFRCDCSTVSLKAECTAAVRYGEERLITKTVGAQLCLPGGFCVLCLCRQSPLYCHRVGAIHDLMDYIAAFPFRKIGGTGHQE